MTGAQLAHATPTSLHAEEQQEMKAHVTIGHTILNANDMPLEATWLLHDHQRWYRADSPDGLRAARPRSGSASSPSPTRGYCVRGALTRVENPRGPFAHAAEMGWAQMTHLGHPGGECRGPS